MKRASARAVADYIAGMTDRYDLETNDSSIRRNEHGRLKTSGASA